jgi:hypothetical protein
MIPLALAASLTVAVETLDWSKASDDLRFGLLKPVMTLEEAERLRAGLASRLIGCGIGRSIHGNMVGFYTDSYTLKPTGHKNDVWVTFEWHGPDSKVAGSTSMVVGLRIDGVRYKRNKEGLYVAQRK